MLWTVASLPPMVTEMSPGNVSSGKCWRVMVATLLCPRVRPVRVAREGEIVAAGSEKYSKTKVVYAPVASPSIVTASSFTLETLTVFSSYALILKIDPPAVEPSMGVTTAGVDTNVYSKLTCTVSLAMVAVAVPAICAGGARTTRSNIPLASANWFNSPIMDTAPIWNVTVDPIASEAHETVPAHVADGKLDT
eukprot:1200009-Rhodomonas_salina.1